jgi:hypothetical protein
MFGANAMKNFPACALLLALASCKTTVAEPPPGDAATRESIVVDGPSRVYARDGSVVASDGVVVQDAPVRAVGEREGSRTYLLELYQQALDAKDALALEVQALQAQSGKDRAERDALLAERDAARGKGDELATKVKRLEAEKLLLEHMIAARASTAGSKDAPREKPVDEARAADAAAVEGGGR